MPKLKLEIAYDGTNYKGWQIQKNQPTIQGAIIKSCEEIFQTKTFELYGSGRTDAGVHALGQVAHLEIKTKLEPDQIKIKLNEVLPSDIQIQDIKPMDPKFHARHDAVARTYVYQISKLRSPFGNRYSWWLKEDLIAENMQKVKEIYTGFKDYKSFGQQDPNEKSTLVEIKSVDVNVSENNILITITGSHFLWNMVRRMVGVMVAAGRKKLQIPEIESFFKKPSNVPGRYTAPPNGLFLEGVYYKGEKIRNEVRRPPLCI